MKKIIIALMATSLYLVPFISQAQVKVLSNGNVGIGTTSPITGLDIRQNFGRITANGLYFYGSGLAQDGLPWARMIENWGIRFASPDNRWVFSTSNSIVIGHVPSGQDWGSGNLFTSGKIGISTTATNYRMSFGNTNTNYKTLALYESGSEFYGLGISGCSFDFWIGNSCAQYRFRDPNGLVVSAITNSGDIFQNNSYARNYYINSDRRLKENIITASNALNKILALRGVYYDLKDSVDTDLLDNETIVVQDTSKSVNKKFKKPKKAYGAASPSKKQYGLIAQEVEIILPELVSTSTTSSKSVNYTAVIPILIEAIRELNTKNEALEAKVKKLEKGKNGAKMESYSTIESISGTYLYQNTPNPFSQETQIRYAVPENTVNAFITITDLAGKQIKTLPISTKGESFVTLQAHELYAGLFAYTLVVDGSIIDTKRMVIVE